MSTYHYRLSNFYIRNFKVPEWYLNQISEDEYVLRRYYDAMTRFANDAIMNVTSVLRFANIL